MATERKLDVTKWQPARRTWNYTPTLWFWYRMIAVAYLDAISQRNGAPTDDALLARDWIAASAPVPRRGKRAFVSFPECCSALGLDADTERVALLEQIDRCAEMDTDAAWARLQEISAQDLPDDVAPLFNAPRIVPAVDQLALF